MLAILFGEASVGRYAVIGVSGVLLDTLLFVLFAGAGVIPVAATAMSTVAGILNNYFWNARLNFRASLNLVHLRRFFTVGLLGLAVAVGSLQLLISAGMASLPAKLVSLPCVLASQFLANKHWTFRER
jgi:putative flippase GtrA